MAWNPNSGRPFPDLPLDPPEPPARLARVIDALNDASEAAAEHAAACRDCCMPIVDEEGNPQYESEACAEGAELLKALIAAERDYWNRIEDDRE